MKLLLLILAAVNELFTIQFPIDLVENVKTSISEASHSNPVGNLTTVSSSTLDLMVSTSQATPINTLNKFLLLKVIPGPQQKLSGIMVHLTGSYKHGEKGRTFLASIINLNNKTTTLTYKSRTNREMGAEGNIEDVKLLGIENAVFDCEEQITLRINTYSLVRRARESIKETVLNVTQLDFQPVFETCE